MENIFTGGVSCWISYDRKVMINLGSMVLHDCVYALRVLPALYTDVCVTLFQGGSKAMDIKVEVVTDMKEEEEREDPLAITCPPSDAEQGVSRVSVYPAVRQLAYVQKFATLLLIKRSDLMQQCADIYLLQSHSKCFGCHSTHHQER